VLAPLDDQIEDLDLGGPAQLLELGDAGLGVELATDGDVGQERTGLARDLGGEQLGAARELRLQRAHQLGEVDRERVGRLGLELGPDLAGGVVGQQVPDVDGAGQPLLRRRHRGDEIEAEQGEVGEIVAGQALVAQMSVDQAQAAEATRRAAQAADVGQPQPRRVADGDVLDGPAPVDQDADLAVELAGQLRHVGGELVGDDLAGRDPSSVDTFEGTDLACF
jgi:hypothetical protein